MEDTETAPANSAELFARLGLTPTAEDLTAMLPAVESLFAAAREIETMLSQETEPGIALRLVD